MNKDLEAREKGLRLVARIEHLSRTSDDFKRWIQEGLDDLLAGRTIALNEEHFLQLREHHEQNHTTQIRQSHI